MNVQEFVLISLAQLEINVRQDTGVDKKFDDKFDFLEIG